jgi:hypothetical protein
MNDLADSSDWIEPVLLAVTPPARYLASCRRVAEWAAAVHRLRLTRQRVGPRPVSIRTFLGDLSRVAGISADVVTGWVGLSLGRPPDLPFAAAWGRLAAALRLDWHETLLLLRLSLLESTGTMPALSGVRARGTPEAPGTALEEGEQAVETVLAGWEDARLDELRTCEEAARRAFTALGG